jgi:hypothetical protein
LAKRKKQVKIHKEPDPKKEIKIASPPPEYKGGILAWRFNAVDRGGPFAWSNLTCSDMHKSVIEKLADFETMDEGALQNKGCHEIETHILCKEAQQRLLYLELDDLTCLFSLRLGSKTRVFCIRRPTYMRVLWWDPEHKVCPSKKKNT